VIRSGARWEQALGWVVVHPSDDQDAEVARLEALGARRIDVGQGERPWVVLADPEGNEFCVLAVRQG